MVVRTSRTLDELSNPSTKGEGGQRLAGPITMYSNMWWSHKLFRMYGGACLVVHGCTAQPWWGQWLGDQECTQGLTKLWLDRMSAQSIRPKVIARVPEVSVIRGQVQPNSTDCSLTSCCCGDQLKYPLTSRLF